MRFEINFHPSPSPLVNPFTQNKLTLQNLLEMSRNNLTLNLFHISSIKMFKYLKLYLLKILYFIQSINPCIH